MYVFVIEISYTIFFCKLLSWIKYIDVSLFQLSSAARTKTFKNSRDGAKIQKKFDRTRVINTFIQQHSDLSNVIEIFNDLL